MAEADFAILAADELGGRGDLVGRAAVLVSLPPPDFCNEVDSGVIVRESMPGAWI